METSRQIVMDIFNRKNTKKGAMWTGHPNAETVPLYAKEWGIEPTLEAIFTFLDDDCRWFLADEYYNHPEGLPALDPGWGINKASTLSSAGCFSEIDNVADIEKYPWPNIDYFDFKPLYEKIDKHQDKMIFTGMWSPFFHDLCDFFGMENYFIQMYENPMVVEAVTEKIVDYYVEANEKFFDGLGNRADVMFFGNDFGTQLDLFISPENFKKFILPSFKRLISVGKKYNKKVMLHSCGSIYRIIPELIDAGVDILHPIQAKAFGMSAKDLAQYKNDLSFVGGIDAQTFFVNATAQEIADEVDRVSGDKGKLLIENNQIKFWKLAKPVKEHCYSSKHGFEGIDYELIDIPVDGVETGHNGVLQNFTNAILFGEELIAPGEEGINGLTISNAIHLSDWIGQTVELPIDSELYLKHLEEKIQQSTANKKTVQSEIVDLSGTYNSRWDIKW